MVLVRNAAAGRGLYIPLLPFPASRILLLKNPAFVLYLTSQNPPVLLPRKSVCRHTLPHRRVRRQPLFRVSRKQRYNTLDFAKQNRVPTGMLRAPIGNPAAKGIFPLQSLIFLAGAYTNCKRQLAMPAQKMQKEACTGAWHRLPFGRKCRRKESIFFCIPAIRAAGTRDNEWKQSVLS